VRGFPFFFLPYPSAGAVSSTPRPPPRGKDGESGAGQGYSLTSRSGHLWCGHHQQGLIAPPHPPHGQGLALDPIHSRIFSQASSHADLVRRFRHRISGTKIALLPGPAAIPGCRSSTRITLFLYSSDSSSSSLLMTVQAGTLRMSRV
jgi:hypothetical protein